MTIVTHPQNLELLKQQLTDGQHDWRLGPGSFWPRFEVRTNPNIPQDQPSGKYRLLGPKATEPGLVIDGKRFRLRTRFCEYGPEDLGYLLLAGVLEEIREALFYFIDEDQFRIRALDFPVITPPRNIIVNAGW